MAEVKWIKIVTDIFDDEKILLIESMPDADSIIVIWFKLLCLAGRQNNSGVFLMNGRIPYTDEMFATIFRRKLNTVRMALRTFEQYGMIEIINDAVTIPDVPIAQVPIIGGDGKSVSIAAASIVAKVTRDRMMVEYAEMFPGYAFEKNKGYGTAAHIEGLKKYGPCEIHRRTFIGHFVDV